MDSNFTVKFGGRNLRVTVTANRYTVADWIRGVNNFYGHRDIVVVGLDVEWRSNGYYGDNNPAATLQLCVGSRCLIVQLIHIDSFPRSLWRFLRNPNYMFAGVGIGSDVAKLERDWGLVCENVYDVWKDAVEQWPERFSHSPGLQELAREVLGLQMEKPRNVTMSDWAAEVLDGNQIYYACVDSFVSCRIGVSFQFDFECFNVQAGDRTIYTTVTASADTVTDWIHSVNNSFQTKRTAIFGLDVEWKPNRNSGYENPVATLQICAGYRCLIIQLFHIDSIPRSLRRFLTNPRYKFAGVEIEKDVEKLEDHHGLICENLYDLRTEALPERLSQCPGLKELADVVGGVYLEKPKHVTLSDWEEEELCEDQVVYACLDAYASCRIGVTLLFDYPWG